jgi:hypothetical protein
VGGWVVARNGVCVCGGGGGWGVQRRSRLMVMGAQLDRLNIARRVRDQLRMPSANNSQGLIEGGKTHPRALKKILSNARSCRCTAASLKRNFEKLSKARRVCVHHCLSVAKRLKNG